MTPPAAPARRPAPATSAAARSASRVSGRAPTVRRSVAPRPARRVSGPVRTPAGRAAPTPRARPGVRAHPAAPLGTRLLAGVRALPDHPLLDRLVRGRTWIVLIGIGLIGIVFMQVSLLKLNAGIGRDVARTTVLQRENAGRRAQVSALESGARISRAAAQLGFVTPPAGSAGFLAPAAGDARRAVAEMRAPGQGIAAAATSAAATGSTPPASATPTGTISPTAPASTSPSTTIPTTAPQTAAPSPTTAASTVPSSSGQG